MASRLEKYSVVKQLAVTNQGKVCSGIDRQSNRMVAMKVANHALGSLENPFEEVRLMTHLQDDGGHPNLVRLVDSFQENKQHVSVWELWKEDMFSLINDRESKSNPLSLAEATFFFQRFLQGVSFLHSHGVAHLDLSLENALHAPTPSQFASATAEPPGLVICDLGQAVQLPSSEHNLGPNFRRGRVQYMSPEMWEGCFDVNGLETDMFSCGVVFFILLFGVPPFYKPTSKDASFRFVMRGRSGTEMLLKSWGLAHRASPSALDLLSRLLCPAATRLTVTQALQHPFFSESRLTSSQRPPSPLTSVRCCAPMHGGVPSAFEHLPHSTESVA